MIRLDLEAQEIALEGPEGEERHALASPEAFAILTEAWIRSGWANRYSYTFTWLGRPIIQLPEDLIRLQELVYQLKPDVILETGIAHGGSLIYHAGLCRLVGQGRVIGIDCEIRPHNRAVRAVGPVDEQGQHEPDAGGLEDLLALSRPQRNRLT